MSEKTGISPPVLSGVEALVQLLVLRHELDQRDGLDTATMVSGYPGSPLGGVDLTLEAQAELLAEHKIRHQPGLNEELAAATVWGSQMGRFVDHSGVDGVAGAWYGKTPGLDRCGDVLRHANALGSGPNGGFVLFCGDDPTAKSSTLTCDSQHAFEDACIPVLHPGNQQELVDFGVHAFRLSRFAGPLVGVKIVTAVADGIGSVDLAADRYPRAILPEVFVDGETWRHEPLAAFGPHQVRNQEALIVRNRLAAAKAYVKANALDRIVGDQPGARLGIVCAGKTYFDVVQALSDLGISADKLADQGIRILKLAMTYPLVEDTVIEFAGSVDRLVVIEEKRPFIETQLRAVLHEAGSTIPVVGKNDQSGKPLVPDVGELNSDNALQALVRLLLEVADRRNAITTPVAPSLAIPPRPPAFCSGCPHNRSTVAPEDALVGGGVGCHGIMYFEARQQGLHKLPPPPMGAEGVPWIGLAPFTNETHLIQNLGDGTLSHSGSLAIRASVAAGVNTTFKILYNEAVAMTGGQEVAGLLDVPALTRSLEAEGVRKIAVCSDDPSRYGSSAKWAPGVEVHPRDDLPAVQEELRNVPGVTAIIYDQHCAAEARRLRKRGLMETPPARVVINPAVCEGCGDCVVKSNCTSVQPFATEFGEKKRIDQLTCNRDYTCMEGDCPSFVTITPKDSEADSTMKGTGSIRTALPEGDLPTPGTASVDGQFGIYFTGIGGTGVITANRILAAAAQASGFAVIGIDQTGLSQRGGAVVSHLRIARSKDELGAAAIGRSGADLYLSGDILQAAQPGHLDRIKPDSTVAAIECEVMPTAAMLQAGIAGPDPDDLRGVIAERIGNGKAGFVNARAIADAVFADAVLANIVLLGAAFQLGGLPFSLSAMEQAFETQQRTAARNRQAFEWGRWAVYDPDAVAAAIDEAHPAVADAGSPFEPSPQAEATAKSMVADMSFPEELRPLLIRRTAQAVDYQDAKLAGRYLDLVERAARKDAPEKDWTLTRTVAEGWYKLLTYKDEFEVARLHRATDYNAIAKDLGIEGAYTLRYHIHPQQLRRFGLKHKLSMGKPIAILFGILRLLKGLRGTVLDPFGWNADRKLERLLISDYERLLLSALDSQDYDRLVEFAASVQAIKGYGQVKERNAAAWRKQFASFG